MAKMNSTVSLQVLCFIISLQGLLFSSSLSFIILHVLLKLPVLCFHGIPECVNKWVSVLLLFMPLFWVVCFVINFILLLFFKPVNFLLRDRKGVDPDWERGAEISRRRGNHNQGLLCNKKKSIFNKWKNNFKKRTKIHCLSGLCKHAGGWQTKHFKIEGSLYYKL